MPMPMFRRNDERLWPVASAFFFIKAFSSGVTHTRMQGEFRLALFVMDLPWHGVFVFVVLTAAEQTLPRRAGSLSSRRERIRRVMLGYGLARIPTLHILPPFTAQGYDSV